MNAQPEQAIACHPTVRRWIYLRAVLIGLLVGAWWFFFAPDSMMDASLKLTLGIVAGLVATGSYLFNLRQTLYPPKNGGIQDATPEPSEAGSSMPSSGEK